MAIFGFSLMDLYDVQFFSSLVTYLRSTYFYGLISGLLGYKVVTTEIPSKVRLRTIDSSPTTNTDSGKISDWLNKQRVVEDIDETSYKKYYLLLLLLLIAGGATWYYWGDISPN